MTDAPHDHATDDAPDDGYRGAATLIDGATSLEVTVTLSGHFDPISGRYSWYGRVAAGPEVTDLVEHGSRTITLRTPHGEVATSLSDVDPWGRPRVAGFGAAPFPVLTTLADETG